MKTIKLKIINYDPDDSCSYGNFIVNVLKKNYQIEFSETPDYLIFNESTSEHLNYNCIKIFYTGENIHPNFNFCDYAFGFDYINFSDRYFRLPIYLVAKFYRPKELVSAANLTFNGENKIGTDDLEKKTDFCSFVYSNYLAQNERKEFFDLLSSYKKVNSGGAYLNNIGYRIDNKLEFERKHKFSIAFENSSNDGYTTEKLINSLMADTIPIYWGNPKIGLEFNTDRFINCHDFNDFSSVVDKIKEIDTNDNIYLKIINSPIYAAKYDPQDILKEFEDFLKNIFDQPTEKARRIKINPSRKSSLIEIEKKAFLIIKIKNTIRLILATIYKPFKGNMWIENKKQQLIKKYKQ